MAGARTSTTTGVILKLSAGILLAGIIGAQANPAAATESRSPVATDDLLPGATLHAEEVEAGVFEVTRDGVRDLIELSGPVVAGQDGSVWLVSSSDLVRLGDHDLEDALAGGFDRVSALAVGPDGRAWTVVREDGRGTRLLSLEDGAWTEHPTLAPALVHLEVAPDGRLWAASRNGVLGVLAEDGSAWQTVDLPTVASRPDVGWYGFTTGDTGIWARYYDGLWHYAEGTWTETPYGGQGSASVPGGVVWGVGLGDTGSDEVLHRHDDAGWARWTLDEHGRLPFWGAHPATYVVAPDGAFWAGWRVDTGAGEGSCEGVSRFDGQDWSRFLAGRCVEAIDVAADGSVWLLAHDAPGPGDREPGPSRLFVITAEAVDTRGR